MDIPVDKVKFVVTQLNTILPLGWKQLNLLSYDNLRSEQRIQLLLEVFKAIDPTIDTTSFEVLDAEEVVVKILDMLRIFKYHPPDDIDAYAFRQGIIECDRDVLTHILLYLLERKEELKKRAYLARFLVKIDISPEVEGDSDIVQLYGQYEELMEEFKQSHAMRESLLKTTSDVQEVQRDISSMQDEKESIMSKLSNLKRKVDPNSNSSLFQLVTRYREEKDKNDRMTGQHAHQERQMTVLKARVTELEESLRDMESSSGALIDSNSRIEDIFSYLEDEINAKKVLVEEILPKELTMMTKHVRTLEDIEGNLSSDYLSQLNSQITGVTKEVNRLLEEKMMKGVEGRRMSVTGDPSVDKVSLFQQNAAEVSKRKEEVRETLHSLEKKSGEVRQKLEKKRSSNDGQIVLRGEALKSYIATVKSKGVTYKKGKSEVNELRTERGVLARSLDILTTKEKDVMTILDQVEAEKGIVGYFLMKEEARSDPTKATLAEDAATQEDLTSQIKALSEKIAQKKAIMAPVIKELRPLRSKAINLEKDYETVKATYDTTAAGLEAGLEKVSQEVQKLKGEKESLNKKVDEANNSIQEEKRYTEIIKKEEERTQKGEGESFVTQLEVNLSTEKQRNQELRAKQRQLADNQEFIQKQLKYWKDLQVLLEVKKTALNRRLQEKASRKRGSVKEDHLVL